ncbi:anthrone oxygenase family protein [Streptomyces sp. HSG2]|uniref:anthrone oxygenase family protein n=1 Tax=Streptomyces sp. HSG2 TaxID=2797167 RepID=UPI0019066477|nr:anthrone oxygenase family protein [Streptomyces sp. HSG2]
MNGLLQGLRVAGCRAGGAASAARRSDQGNTMRPSRALPAAATPPDPVLVAATIGTGLMAGLYLGFDVGVMLALARRGDERFVAAMRRANDALDDNAPFGALFLGVFLATGVAARRLDRADGSAAAREARSAAVLYGLSVVVTICVNLPLNRRLRDASGTSAADLAAARAAYERPWRRANAVRTVACLAALALLGDAARRRTITRAR